MAMSDYIKGEVMTADACTLIRGMPEGVYHSDPCVGPTLSASIAKIIANDGSLAHAHLAHPRLGGEVRAPKDAFDKGTVVHEMLLGNGAEVRVLDFDNWRTKASKEAKELARSEGATPMLRKDYANLEEAAEGIRNRLKAMGLAFGTETEVSGFWVQDGVPCRMRMDDLCITPDRIIITDLKTCRSAKPENCNRDIIQYGYDVQRATYIDAVEHILPGFRGKVEFQWVFAEIEPPYAVTPMYAPESLAHMGRQKWEQALARWRHALEVDEWPCYVEGPVVAEPPYWALKQFYGDRMEDE